MSYSLDNKIFSKSMTKPLFDDLVNIKFEIQKDSKSFSHICISELPFTHVENNLALKEAYKKYYHELADKVETFILNFKDELGPIVISKNFTVDYERITTEAVVNILSGHKKYLLFLNGQEPEINTLGEKFIVIASKFAIIKRDDVKKTLAKFLCIVEIQEWVVDESNPEIANKISTIDCFVID